MALFPTFTAWIARLRKPDESPSAVVFPTFARAVAGLLPTSSGQRRALAGLLAFAIDEKLDPVPLLEAWARDERGWQQARVERLARLLGRGMPIGQALERVPGAVRRQDATALSVAAGLGGDATEAIAVFDAPAASTDRVERGLRWTFGYVLTLVLIALPITAFLAIRISTQYVKIFDDFGMPHSRWMAVSRGVINLVCQFWFVPFLGLLVAKIAARIAPRAWRAFESTVTFGHLGTAGDARAADWLGSLDVAANAHAGSDRAVTALANAAADEGLRTRLRRGGGLPKGVLSPAEAALVAPEAPGGRSWVAEALARRHRERILDRKWLLSELLLPLFVLVMGAFVFLQTMGIMAPLVDLIGGLV